MTKQAMTDFLEAVRTDEATAGGLIEAIGGNQESGAVETFAAFARERGFAVTPQDVEELRALLEQEGTLSETQLDAVAGGNGGGDIAIFSTFLRKVR